MTRKEIIKWLESLKAEIGKSEHRTLWYYAEAIDMVIEALSEPSGDLISRKDAIEAVAEDLASALNVSKDETRELAENALSALPSADAAQGKWEYCENEIADHVDGYKCSNCGFFIPWDYEHKFINFIKDYNFCPSCRADMRGENK